MKVSDFHFDLPEALIAHYPPEQRGSSRLLQLDGESGELRHGVFADLLEQLSAGDLLVMNNTRVIPARLFGQKASGGKIEILVERILSDHEALVHLRSSRSPKPGTALQFEGGIEAAVLGRADALFHLRFGGEQTLLELLETHGHMPLPPYIKREDQLSDRERYQTVYNAQPGAVAAPTAGLHFDQTMLEALKQKGVELAYVTLHVGAGTFQPVKVDSVDEHKMHSEWFEVSEAVAEAVRQTQQRGGRVVAVGTTSVRSLESASRSGAIQAYRGETEIFIYPGYEFQTVDALITNFHLPESTLLMLVSAFAGYDAVMNAYREAVAQAYRFFSYGDAMFLTRNPSVPASAAQE